MFLRQIDGGILRNAESVTRARYYWRQLRERPSPMILPASDVVGIYRGEAHQPAFRLVVRCHKEMAISAGHADANRH